MFDSRTVNNHLFNTPSVFFMRVQWKGSALKQTCCAQKGKQENILKEELLVFFAINIIMGYHQLPTTKHYWMQSDNMGVKFISASTAPNHSSFILGKLHLKDNSKIDPAKKDKLFKLRPVLEGLNELL